MIFVCGACRYNSDGLEPSSVTCMCSRILQTLEATVRRLVKRSMYSRRFDGQGGENCVAVKGSRKLAKEQTEARWYDTECDMKKPFVCQAFGVSTPFSLTVSTELTIAAGYVTGAGSLISSTLAQVNIQSEEEIVSVIKFSTILDIIVKSKM